MAVKQYRIGEQVILNPKIVNYLVSAQYIGEEAVVVDSTLPNAYKVKTNDGNTWLVGVESMDDHPVNASMNMLSSIRAVKMTLRHVGSSGYNGGGGGSMLGNAFTATPPELVTVTETKFEIGDEVEAISGSPMGHTGTVVSFKTNLSGTLLLGVRFSTWNDGHGLKGTLPQDMMGNESTQGYYLQLSQVILKHKKGKVSAHQFDAKKLDPLVISKDVKEEITSVLRQHQNHTKLFDEWGLGDVIEYGRGMTFMFYGGPGTGKTWGAHCIAKAMGAELLIVSAAEIQSSEPGGANRALQAAFKAAKQGNKVLFLDECDSLITNRGDLGMVLASEVNTLLTEIEKFEGIAILATNRVDTMDEALERRISLIVEFPSPDLAARKKIWAKLLPKKMPIAKNVTPATLAKHELTGGQIKNVVLQAARLALSEEAKTVSAKHFKVAIERIKKSKNLMGTASRYRQGAVDDFHVHRGHGHVMGIGKHRHKSSDSLRGFLKEIDDEDGNA